MQAPSAAEQAPPLTVYRCHSRSNLGPDNATLTIDKTFREDGSVEAMNVAWEDNAASFVQGRLPGDYATVRLDWSAGVLTYPEPRPFAWSRGSIRVNQFGPTSAGRYRQGHDERWTQTIVDRDGSVRGYDSRGIREILLLPSAILLSSQLESRSGVGGLSTALDPLLAWGAGVPRLTVYETAVTYRRYDPHSFPNDPAGGRRVIAEYDLETAALPPIIAQIRQATEAWDAGLGDFRTRCERGVDESGQAIVVT